MSTTAPWFALAVDWQDSPMFDEASEAVRLAWVCLLCHAKSMGRGGKVRLRKEAFAANYRLDAGSVEQMLDRAVEHRAVSIDGETVSLLNWQTYQAKGDTARSRQQPLRSGETKEKSATGQDTSHITKHRTGGAPPVPNVVENVLRTRAIAALDRLMGIQLTSGQMSVVDRFAMSLGENEIGGKPVDAYTLIEWAASDAIEQNNRPNSVNKAIDLLRAICNRCIRDGLKPGEYREREAKRPLSVARPVKVGMAHAG